MINLKPFRIHGGYSIIVHTGTGFQDLPLEDITSYWDAIEFFREHSRYIGLLKNGIVLVWRKGYQAIN